MGDKHKLFVGNLPKDCTQEELRIVFNTYGNTTDIHVMSGKSSSGQCCAFVVYDRQVDAETAINTLDNVYSIREGETPLNVKWADKAKQASAAPAAPAGGGYQGHYGAPSYGAAAYGGGGQAYSGYSPTPSYGYAQPGYGDVPPPPPPPTQMAQQTTKVFVGNLPNDIQQDAIRMVFGTYGTVVDVHIMAGKSKSGQACAFVSYSNQHEADTSILTLNDKYEIRPGEGPITVKYATNQGSASQPRARPY